ncbi:hypothetical protein G5B40_12575 [Pikeienuella piscinae]|uniref:Glutathione S-transferase n=1 Tax=Pikeienuella piscinae TaxID=2748098 RepID=A0A7L5BV60_9RHOB|nr:MAPEG family protein [Pikeienuella piscinae]QIE56220.1 hypothetical protein G5B40_12575 [Pikeienuella piscinae]
MNPPAIAAFYSGLNALILLWLTVEVVLRRRSGRISLGDGGDEVMNRLIRGHANATETMPIALILLILAELLGAPGLALHGLGVLLTVGRLLHGLRFTGRGPMAFRLYGMAATLIATVLLALCVIGLAAGRLF